MKVQIIEEFNETKFVNRLQKYLDEHPDEKPDIKFSVSTPDRGLLYSALIIS